jgi:hypothetical protein
LLRLGKRVPQGFRRGGGCFSFLRHCFSLLPGRAKERIPGIKLETHRHRFLPFRANPTGGVEQFGGEHAKWFDILAAGVNLEQLQMNGVAPGIFLFCLEENLFRLCVTAVRHVDISFSNRIHFIGVDAAWDRPG